MSATWVTVAAGLCVFCALLAWGRAGMAARTESWARAVGAPASASVRGLAHVVPPAWTRGSGTSAVGLALAAGLIGLRLAGPLGMAAAAAGGAVAPFLVRRRQAGRRAESMERQLAELVETVALGVRGGLGIRQAVVSAAGETGPPLGALLQRMLAEIELGVAFEDALDRFQAALGSDDGRLFILVIGVHARSGGNLAGALDEVSSTIRHRVAVRRELRALSAQGRISGAILGSLPIAFFLVLAATSHRDLAPVYRSSMGMAMIGAGLTLQAMAYLWIRRLLRVDP